MLSSLWNQVVGTASESEDNESDLMQNSNTSTHYYRHSPSPSRRSHSSSSHHNHNQENRTGQNHNSIHKQSNTHPLQQTDNTEEDKLAISLLSKFPPYGSHSALIRKHPHHNHHLIGAGGAAGAAGAAAAAALNESNGGTANDAGTGPHPNPRSLSGSPTKRNRNSTRGSKGEAGEARSRSLSVKNQRYYDDDDGSGDNDYVEGTDEGGDGHEGGMNRESKITKDNNIWSDNDELDIWKSTNTNGSPTRRRRRHCQSFTKRERHRPNIIGGESGSNQRHSRDRAGRRSNSNNHNNHKHTDRNNQQIGHKMDAKKGTGVEQGHPYPHPHNNHPSTHRRKNRRKRSNHGGTIGEYSSFYWNEELRKKWITDANHTASSKTAADTAPDGSVVASSGAVVVHGSGGSGPQSRSPHRIGDAGKSSSSSPNSRPKGVISNTNNNHKDSRVGARSGQHFTFSFDEEDEDDDSSYESSTSSTEDYYYDDDYSDNSEYLDDYDNGNYDTASNKCGNSISRFNHYQPHRTPPPRQVKSETPTANSSNGNITDNGSTGEDQNKKGWYLQHGKNEEKQHWMPDELCKTCYACESQFNPFRRRHHCRLCGQVFCSRCSAFFVEMEGDRTLIKGDGGGEVIVGGGGGTSGLRKSSSTVRMVGNDGASMEGTSMIVEESHIDNLGGGDDTSRVRLPVRTIRTCKLCYDHVSESNSGTVVPAAVGTWFGSSSRRTVDNKRSNVSSSNITTNNTNNEDAGGGSSDADASSVDHLRQQQDLTGGNKDNGTVVSLGDNLARFPSVDPSSVVAVSNGSPNSNGDKLETSQSYGSESKQLAIATSTSDEFAYASIAQQLLGYKGSGTRSESEILNLAKQKLDEDHARRQHLDEDEEGTILSSASDGDDDDSYMIRSGSGSGSSSKVGIIGKTKSASSSITRRFGRLAESAARENLVGDHGFNDDEVKLVGTGVSVPSEEDEEEEEGLGDDDGGGSAAERHPNIGSIPDIPSGLVLQEENGRSGSGEKSQGDDTITNDSCEGVQEESSVNIKKQCAETVKQANKQLGLCAANHLEKMGRELLRSDAVLLLEEKGIDKESCAIRGSSKVFDDWVNSLMMLATRCCATVIPNLRHGDMLDIRPYCKVKVIPGGKLEDAAYISGIAFRKNVSHKTMAKEMPNPRIMLLSGGIEYTRTENKFASLDTLLEQESKYMEIIVTKITKLKPDVLMVGRSVNRKAQELLLSRTNIVLLQHVKVGLMERIARQTGATILSSTNQIMNQFGNSVLGKCRRFRLVTFRNNEIWHDNTTTITKITTKDQSPSNQYQNISALLTQKDLPNHHRQAALAASLLGESVHSAQDAVRTGIAKRGVAMTYGLIEGCPSHLGCTVVLRGASRPALKQVKRLFQFLINAAYNLKLETSYLRARRAMLPTPEYTIDPSKPTMSTSLCVDYGDPPVGRKVARPWNGGGKGEFVQRSISGKITALDHQSILISSVWMAGKTQCCPAELKGICYYSKQDVSLGQFLRDSCLNLQVKCPNLSCKKSILEHSLSFIHNDGLINITVEKMDEPLPLEKTSKDSHSVPGTDNKDENNNSKTMKGKNPIATWSYCLNCSKVVTPLNYLTEDTWKLSFGKFLEVLFYNKEMVLNAPEHKCNCTMQSASTLYFGCGDLAARFTYERIRPYGVYLRRNLPSDDKFHRDFAFTELETISKAANQLFSDFDAKVADVTRDTRQLFGGGSLYQQHQQSDLHQKTILSELKTISTEVRRASKILTEKITSVTNRFRASQQKTATSYGESSRNKVLETFLCFPWHSRRYLFLLASAWNDRLSTIGQALVAMKKLLASTAQLYSSGINSGRIGGDMGLVQTSGGDGGDDDMIDAMQRIRQLRDVYSDLNVNDMSIQPTVKESLQYTRRNPRNSNNNNIDGMDLNDTNYDDFDDEFGGGGGDMAASGGEETKFNFAEEVDADVLASRQRRQAQTIDPNGSNTSNSITRRQQQNSHTHSRSRSTSRSRGENNNNNSNQDNAYSSRRGRRNDDHPPSSSHHGPSSRTTSRPRSSRSQSPSPSISRPVTAGGAVKSAITRFFNRGNKEQDPYVIDLGIFSDGRPKLEPGIDGIVVPIFDDQPSTIIAYSLSSEEYNDQFNRYAKSETSNESTSETPRPSNSGRGGGDSTIEDFSAGPGGLESPHRLKQDNHGAPHKRGRSQHRSSAQSSSGNNSNAGKGLFDEKKSLEKRMLVRNKTHIKHTFRDHDEKGQQIAKFVCTTYWATQFQAVRHAFLKDSGATENASSSASGGGGGVSAQTSRYISERGRLAIEKSYNKSLSTSTSWAASGGKSGASFSKTSDDRFIVKCISRTELQMFLDCAPAYFKYVSKAFFQGLPTMLSKIVGVYQIGYHNRVTGKRTMEQVAVMQNIFFKRKISKVFDLKGTLGRFAKRASQSDKEKNDNQQVAPATVDASSTSASTTRKVSFRKGHNTEISPDDDDSNSVKNNVNMTNSSSGDEEAVTTANGNNSSSNPNQSVHDNDNAADDADFDSTMLDGDFLEFTGGRPLPLNDRAKATLHMSILNDTLFLTIINVLDYSILVGIDEERNELVVGIIDFMRQYDILKQMERVGKSIPMVVGSEAPTIIQPPLYKARFINAMLRYFMTVPSKWTTI